MAVSNELNNRPNFTPLKERLLPIIAVTILALVVFLAYMPVFGMRPLLDEQFLLDWMSHGDFGKWLAFRGANPHDDWGPLATFFTCCGYTAGFKSIFMFRLRGVALHIIATVFLFFVVRNIIPATSAETSEEPSAQSPEESSASTIDATIANALALFSALIFALHPLAPEAVAWVGGRAQLIGLVLFLGSFYSYLRHCRQASGPNEVNTWTVSALVLLIFSALCDQACGFLGLVFCAWKFAFNRDSNNRTGNWITPIVLAGAGLLTLVVEAGVQGFNSFAFTLNPVDLGQVFRNLLIPINRARWSGYAVEYKYMYVILALYAVAVGVAVFRNKQARAVALVGFVWLCAAVLPFSAIAVHADDLYGARWLYSATAAIAIVLAIAANSLLFSAKFSQASIPLQVPFLILLLLFEGRHLSNQNNSYRVAAKILNNIQSSAKMIAQKNSSNFVLARDLPSFLSVEPIISPFHLVVLDGTNGKMRAPLTPGGPLKTSLASDKYRNITCRWDETFHSLIPIILLPEKNTFSARTGQALAGNTQPPLSYWKTISFDNKEGALKMDSNSSNGPGVSFYTDGISPLDGDFMEVQAKVNAPNDQQYKDIELHWLTKQQGDHEHNDRRTWTAAVENDNKYHDYLLSLRSTGWTTNGEITSVTVGFPSGASVFLKGMQIVGKTGLVPTLKLQINGGDPGEEATFQDFCVDYPQIPDLGLARLSGKRAVIDVDADVSSIKGAHGYDVQFEPLDGKLHPENEAVLDEKQGTVVHCAQTNGTTELGLKRFDNPGIYRVRVIAVDANQAPVGRFSDSAYVQVIK